MYFDFGPDVFKKRIAEATFPVLAANLRDEQGQPITNIEDTQMLQFGSAKIGVIGLAADNSPVKSSPGNLQFAPIVETGIAQQRVVARAAIDRVVAGQTVDAVGGGAARQAVIARRRPAQPRQQLGIGQAAAIVELQRLDHVIRVRVHEERDGIPGCVPLFPWGISNPVNG